MEQSVGLRSFFHILRKRFNIILWITALSIVFTSIYSYWLVTPMYRSSTMFLVSESKPEGSINYNEIQTNLELINTYRVIIKSPRILDNVIRILDLDVQTSELNEMITIFNESNSQVSTINVIHPSPIMAAEIANTIATVFQSEVPRIMNVNNVTILSEAKAEGPFSPVYPKPMLNLLLASIIGLMLGMAVTLILEYLDNTIESEDDIERKLGIPVIGAIPILDKAPKR